MSNPTPPTILRNLYAKLETMEKELNENSNSPSTIQQKQENPKPPMSPLTLPSNGNPNDMKKQYNVVDKMSKLSINDSRYSNNSNGSSQVFYQDNEFVRHSSSIRSDSNGQRGRSSYSDKENEYNSPKINSIRPTPSINTYYNPQNPRYNQRSEDDTFVVAESPIETEIPRYYNGNYGNSYPQNQAPQYDRIRSPGNNSFAFSPDSATFYNDVSFQNTEASIPKIDEYGNYLSDYKQQGDNGREVFIPHRQSDYSAANMTKSSISNSFDLNTDLEAHARSFATDSVSESMSDSKSFLAATAEIDMDFDPSILSRKGKKYMKDLVNSNNFHKGGNLTICTSVFLNKKKTLFYALTTHRLYAFKEDRSGAELITYYVIDKDTKCTKANVYSGVRSFELTTYKNGDKQRGSFEFECTSKEDKEEWLHSINKVVQLHKYHDKTLPPPPDGAKADQSYTSTLKTPNMKPGLPTPSISPEISPSLYSPTNTSFSGSYKSSSTPPQYSSKYEPSIASQASGNYQKVSPMYQAGPNVRRNSPQPVLVNSLPNRQPPMKGQPSPMMNPTNPQMGSPNFQYMNRNQKNLPINQLINNTPPMQGRNPTPSPRVNYYQRSPVQRPQGN